MALVAGTRFGPYEIAAPLGAGGMGEVYRAHDTTLERDVAIKVLPASFANDASRVERFEREAKTLAALNHPNIAHIYGLEKSDGTTALVMELVEGPTLEDRIADGPLPADEALGIAMQIADALEAAHGQNIVHRDLKPANVKVRTDGTVKVLDFGIAKALAPENLATGPQSPVMTTPATQVGVILGTAAYMSPEQAKGKGVDQRTDIWAFGCLLYEMLTGQLAFGAEDVPTTLARVIANDTNLDTLPAEVSPAVRKTIELCLQKDVRKRVRDIGDVKLALEGAFESDAPLAAGIAATARPFSRRALPVATTAAIAIAGTVIAMRLLTAPEPHPVYRFEADLPAGQIFRFAGRPVMDVSPDGRYFVFNTDGGFFLRSLSDLEPRLIPGTEGDARAPTFSPDGQSIVFWDGVTDELKRIAITGGAAVAIAPVASNVFGLSWAQDGTVFVGQPEGIYRVSANGGTPELIVRTEEGRQADGARLLPDGDSVLFSLGPRGDADAAQIVVQSLATGERKVLIEGGNDARYLETGHLVYALGDVLFAVPFDLERLAVTGGAVPVAQGTMRTTGGLTGSANYGVSSDGTLVYTRGDVNASSRLVVWMSRDGVAQPLALPPRSFEYVQLSPDGQRIALSALGEEQDVWVWDIDREALTRLTVDAGLNRAPVWSPDGQRLAFTQSVDSVQEIFWQAADGSGAPAALTENSPGNLLPGDFSPDGSTLLYTVSDTSGNEDVWTVQISGDTRVGKPLLDSAADESSPALSPDGRWLAYQSDESGVDEIYVRPFPNVGSARTQISTDGGSSPVWSRDGSELFYFKQAIGPGDAVMGVAIEDGPVLRFGRPVEIFNSDIPAVARDGAFYDVSPDGQRFLMIRNPAAAIAEGQAPFVIVENWFEELERLVPKE